jgi:ATP-binding cassette subfamily F protein 3
VLLAEPQALLLDEPTNHLDPAMLEWLEDWLAAYPGAALIVSHDRAFLDRIVTRILELGSESHGLREYAGNYSDYVEQTTAEHERRWEQWRGQEAEVRRVRADIARTREQAMQVERTTTPRQPGVRRIAKKVAVKARSREKKLARYLDSGERVEKPKAGWQMKLEFGQAPATGQDVLALEDLAVGYAGVPLLAGLTRTVRQGARIALMGPNGSGKSTLVRTLVGQLPPVAGRARLGANVRVGYLAQEQESLDPALDAISTIQALAPFSETEARAFLHYFLFSGDEVFTPAGSLSFGERARLNLAALVAGGCNLLLLDEPINHLDIPSRARFEQALSGFAGTSLALVHDRYFVERYATEVWSLSGKPGGGIQYDLTHQWRSGKSGKAG